jgi:site-specific recombinase XerD
MWGKFKMASRAVVPSGQLKAKPQPVTVKDGDIGGLARSFQRGLQAANRSPATVRIYTIGVAQLADFLVARGMPQVVANSAREHIEEWLADIQAQRSAGTAEARYRGAKAFFDWAVEEGEIKTSPLPNVKDHSQARHRRPSSATTSCDDC